MKYEKEIRYFEMGSWYFNSTELLQLLNLKLYLATKNKVQLFTHSIYKNNIFLNLC